MLMEENEKSVVTQTTTRIPTRTTTLNIGSEINKIIIATTEEEYIIIEIVPRWTGYNREVNGVVCVKIENFH